MRPHRQSSSANIHSIGKAIKYIVFHMYNVQDTSKDQSASTDKDHQSNCSFLQYNKKFITINLYFHFEFDPNATT